MRREFRRRRVALGGISRVSGVVGWNFEAGWGVSGGISVQYRRHLRNL